MARSRGFRLAVRQARRTHPPLCGPPLGDDTADDVVSETFLAAFRQRRDYDTARPEALPWLYGFATNFIRRISALRDTAIRRTRKWACFPTPTTPRNKLLSGRARMPYAALSPRRSPR
ncbi:sigma factor [Streptosporangium lutulentum]